MLRLLAVLLLIPLLDAILLMVIASQFVTWELVVLLVVLTALLGTLLVRAEGRHTIQTIQRKLQRGEVPTDEVIDGGLLLVAGAFFLTPGLVTDAIALALTIPVTRYPIRVAAKRWVITPYLDAKSGGFVTGNVYVGGAPGDVDDAPGWVGAGGPGNGSPSGPGDPGGPGGAGPGGAGGVGPDGAGPNGGASTGGGGAAGDSDGGFDPDDATDIDFEESDEE